VQQQQRQRQQPPLLLLLLLQHQHCLLTLPWMLSEAAVALLQLLLLPLVCLLRRCLQLSVPH
jgi:hypothetical protein